MNWKARRAAAIQAARAIAEKARAENRGLTPEERTEFDAQIRIKEAAETEGADEQRINDLLGQAKADQGDDDTGAPPPHKIKTIGDYYKHQLLAAGHKSLKGLAPGATFAAPEVSTKAASDPILEGSVPQPAAGYGPLLVETETGAYPVQRRLTIADLLVSGTLDGAAIQYPVWPALQGSAATVAENGAKPQVSRAAPTWQIDALSEIAAWFTVSDQMAEDLGYIVSEINSAVAYDLLSVEENQLLYGTGSGPNLRGITERSGIQTATGTTASMADDIYRTFSRIQTLSGFAADGIVINPEDYETLRLTKDGNDQYFGGGYFAGQYGNGSIMVEPPIWGRRTVVTEAITAGTILVGAWHTAKLFTKGGIQVESTNSHNVDFIHDRITTRLRKRVGLQVKYPAAFLELTIT